MTEQEKQAKIKKWQENAWLRDAKTYQVKDDGIHYCLKNFYEDCIFDLESAKKCQYVPDWIKELEEAVNELSLIILYNNSMPE